MDIMHKRFEERVHKAKELAIPLFETIRTQFADLTMKLDLEPQGINGADLVIPVQNKLPFEVFVCLDCDELTLSAGKHFWVQWFPCDDEVVVAMFREAVIGLLSGNYRIVEFYRGNCWLRAELQRPEEQAWKPIKTSINGMFPFSFLIPWWLPPKEIVLRLEQ
jgi:hypothetical protein